MDHGRITALLRLGIANRVITTQTNKEKIRKYFILVFSFQLAMERIYKKKD